ncbi:hypothetical protein AVEN_44746-1 [Araneus ventricosus]|uniref:Cuticle protein 10.9 n=1 Tax=Araneus ventricosus TaxID=182803 RepID=A0A4Y2HQR8_ARAVE|nr:hypothetical protein AVEN_44746-1 [Araneus ventricosus]
MHTAKVVLFMVVFYGCASIIVSAIVPMLSALNHGNHNFGSRKLSQPAALRRFQRASSNSSSRGLRHNEAPKSYKFNYFIDDDQGNTHYRDEEADESGTVRGSYGYTDATGLFRIVAYTADSNGFRANIKTNEPSLVGQKSSADVILNDYPSASDVHDEPRPYTDEKESEKGISGEIGRYPEVKPSIQHGITGVVIGSYASQLEPKNDTEESDTYMAKEKV